MLLVLRAVTLGIRSVIPVRLATWKLSTKIPQLAGVFKPLVPMDTTLTAQLNVMLAMTLA